MMMLRFFLILACMFAGVEKHLLLMSTRRAVSVLFCFFGGIFPRWYGSEIPSEPWIYAIVRNEYLNDPLSSLFR